MVRRTLISLGTKIAPGVSAVWTPYAEHRPSTVPTVGLSLLPTSPLAWFVRGGYYRNHMKLRKHRMYEASTNSLASRSLGSVPRREFRFRCYRSFLFRQVT